MNYGDDQTGLRIRGKRAGSFVVGTLLMLGLLAAPDCVGAADAPVGDQAPMQAPDLGVSSVATIALARTRFLSLGVGKSVVIDLPREVKDVLVADPKIA
ncbi:MAG: secretin, partial [Bradyrhizobiaceae bacterium]